jgi:hypothetical protein
MTPYTNKNIILVGNSVELIEYDFGKFIDSHDIVIRLGKGANTTGHEEHIGSKLDIWATGFLREPMHKHRLLKNVPVLLNRNRMSIHVPRKHKMLGRDVTEMFSDEEILEFDTEFKMNRNNRERLSNGLITILYFTRKETDWKSFTIIGFDCFSKSLSFQVGRAKPFSWHLPANTVPDLPHNGKKEREIILEEANKFENFNWVVLSDFSREDIF